MIIWKVFNIFEILKKRKFKKDCLRIDMVVFLFNDNKEMFVWKYYRIDVCNDCLYN